MAIQLVAITSINPDAGDALNKYLSVVGPLMESAGAKVVRRYELVDSIMGEKEIQYVSLIDYPDKAAIELVFESDEYKALEAIKRQAFSKYQVSSAVTL